MIPIKQVSKKHHYGNTQNYFWENLSDDDFIAESG